MPVFVALLRGINLGPHRRMKMETLRSICESLGFEGVRTYVQSGNVVFRSKQAEPASVASRLRKAIGEAVGFEPEVFLRTAADLKLVIDRNPFALREDVSPDKLLVTFLERQPEPGAVSKVSQMRIRPEEFAMVGRELYVFYPDGMGRSKFPAAAISQLLKDAGTARNWNTVLKLFEIATAAE